MKRSCIELICEGNAKKSIGQKWKGIVRQGGGTAQGGDQLTGNGTAECSREKKRNGDGLKRNGVATTRSEQEDE